MSEIGSVTFPMLSKHLLSPPNLGRRLKEGMVITIEPMLNTGMYHAKVDLDGWTARTVDGSLSAQYEHTLAITANGPEILTKQ